MPEPSYKPEYSHSWALLVGIDDYRHGRLPPLHTAVKGVRALADLLQSAFGFDPACILTLENEQATRSAILRAFTDPLSRPDRAGPDDRVLIYFAGHGITFDTPQGEVGCIVPYDVEAGYIDTTIPMDDMTRLADRIYAKHVLFLLDACFSGFATTREAAPGVERQVEDLLTRPARQVIAAGTRDQAVADLWGPGGHSLFTGFLLDGLRGASPAPGGILRAFHLAGYLQDQVAQHSRSRQTPQYAPLMGSQGGDFIFSVREVLELPAWLLAAVNSDDPTQRLVAVGQLRTLARGEKPDEAAQALAKLEEMAAGDGDLMVRQSAQAALQELVPQTDVAPVEREKPVAIEPQPPVVKEPTPAIEAPPVTPTKPAAGLPAWAIGALAVGALLVIGLVLRSVFAPLAATPTPPPPPAEEETTPTEEPTTEPAIALALRGVTSNDEWTSYIQEFNGVEMALVPAGCFMMGSTEDEVDYAFELCEKAMGEGECERGWYEGETPRHEICFDEPFWIDVYEVTNEQYGSSGKWSGDNLPRETVTWSDAVAHCEGRGARLPTEAEWEYAARGPDGLIFPWGNEFDGSRLNFCDSNCRYEWTDATMDDGYEYTAPIGSYRDGASWAGALDMSGNVWEWVSSIYEPYPYDPTDGREADVNSDSSSTRALRGGSWNAEASIVRAARRGGGEPSNALYHFGFRCARSY
jgi:formylglycine-generating enzyme required for sulfatase activity